MHAVVMPPATSPVLAVASPTPQASEMSTTSCHSTTAQGPSMGASSSTVWTTGQGARRRHRSAEAAHDAPGGKVSTRIPPNHQVVSATPVPLARAAAAAHAAARHSSFVAAPPGGDAGLLRSTRAMSPEQEDHLSRSYNAAQAAVPGSCARPAFRSTSGQWPQQVAVPPHAITNTGHRQVMAARPGAPVALSGGSVQGQNYRPAGMSLELPNQEKGSQSATGASGAHAGYPGPGARASPRASAAGPWQQGSPIHQAPQSTSQSRALSPRSAFDAAGAPQVVTANGCGAAWPPAAAPASAAAAALASRQKQLVRGPMEALDLSEAPRDNQLHTGQPAVSPAGSPQVGTVGSVAEQQELLKRLEAIEAKVSGRDQLLAKLSKQQARLDRLEVLARENEMLRAQVRNPQAKATETTTRTQLAATPTTTVKDQLASRSRGVTGRVSGALQGGARGLPTKEAQQQASRLEPSIMMSSHDSGSLAGGAIGSDVGTSNGCRMLSPRMELAHAGVVGKETAVPTAPASWGKLPGTGSGLPRNELESRLSELEMALGLPPGGAEALGQRRRPSGATR